MAYLFKEQRGAVSSEKLKSEEGDNRDQRKWR